ncbi:MAG: hypothetical protein Q8J68_01830 [Methanolobus sp.]|uniref:hypothetical protein n=1 Tax=Methanolobus sp. TaxID=1874737 RepID=UPI0027311BCE|nr:hypothetical protein [Methanolobus sp.]MDP2216016.1 hypothetical protein [Methanolobus sp.]
MKDQEKTELLKHSYFYHITSIKELELYPRGALKMIVSPYKVLNDYGIDTSILTNYKVLILPENIEDKNEDEFKDTIDSLSLYKNLKASRIECANSNDLGLDTYFFERRGADIWLGTVWILENVVVPFVLFAICDKINNHKKNETEEDISALKVLETQVHLNLRFPNGSKIKYDGDAKTLSLILETFAKRE